MACFFLTCGSIFLRMSCPYQLPCLAIWDHLYRLAGGLMLAGANPGGPNIIITCAAMQEHRLAHNKRCQRVFYPQLNPDQMHETIFKISCTFHYVIDENCNWGHYVICDITSQAYYITWYWLNIYLVVILFEPNLIHTSRRYGKGRWFDRMFAPIFEDIITLKLINGYHITHTTIVIVNLTDIWGRYKQPMIQVVQHNHS